MPPTPAPRILLPLLTALLFSGSFVAGKFTTLDLQPLTTALLRYVIAFAFLCLLALARKESLRITQPDALLLALALAGLCGIVGYHFFFFSALRLTDVANTAIINATSPILTGALAAIFLKERLSLLNIFGLLLAFMGVILLLAQGQLENLLGLRINTGDALMLCAVISWVLYALLVKTLVRRLSGFVVTFYSTAFGVLFLLPLALGAENPIAQLQTISIQSLLAVVYMGVGASGVGYLLYNLSIKNIGPTRTSSIVYSFVPVFTAVLAALFFQQALVPVMILSMALIITGLNLMLRQQPINPPRADPDGQRLANN